VAVLEKHLYENQVTGSCGWVWCISV
jgi:hypothetical protein